MANILFVRHAQSKWNVEHRWQGQADPPLSDYGHTQAMAAGTRLSQAMGAKTRLSYMDTAISGNLPSGPTPTSETMLPSDVGAIVSSDLRRARTTANIIANAADIDIVLTDPRLRERDIGLWQGLTTTEIEHRYPGALSAGRYPHDWESDESLLDRTFAALRQITELVGNEASLIVSHAGVIYALERYFGISFKRIENLQGRQIIVQDNKISLAGRVALLQDTESTCPQ